MTAQALERLTHQGRVLGMRSEPLAQYFALTGEPPAFAALSTANWRGYVGDWEIVQDRLYLVGLRGEFESGEKVHLHSLFPGFPTRVFAHWFSGTISIPEGKMTGYVHMGYLSQYEKDRFLVLRRGYLVKEWVRDNRSAP